jgi:hypothetical protein
MRQIAYHVAASWINANAAVQLARDIRIPLGDCRHGSGCPLFAMSDAVTSLNPQASVPTGRSQCSRRDFCFARLTMRQSSLELWSRRGSWRGHHPATAVATRDYSVRVLCHQYLVELASDVEPRRTLSLQRGARRVRNDHVVAPMLRSSRPEHRTISQE